MSETTIELNVPAPLLQLGIGRDEIQRRLAEWLILSLFTEGRISSGKAARLIGISRVEFLALLRARGVAYLNYSPEEMAEEFVAVDELDLKTQP